MEIRLNDLRVALKRVEGALPAKPSIAVIAGLLFEVDGDVMSITATDLENTVRAKCALTGNTGKSKFVVQGKEFISLARGLIAETATLELKDNMLKVSAGKSKYEFPTMEASEYPVFPKVKKEKSIKIKQDALLDGLNAVAFCVDAEEPRPQFRGILVDVMPKKIVFVGTDTKTLATKEAETANEITIKALVTLKTTAILNKLLTGTGEVTIYLDDRSMYLEQENLEVSAQLLAGCEDFPDYVRVIPEKDMLTADMPISHVRNAIDRLIVFTTERYKKIVFDFKKDSLVISTVNPEKGKAVEEVDITYDYDGKDMRIALSADVMKFLSRVTGDIMTLGIKDGKSPVLITGEDITWKGVVMPLKLEE